MTVNKTISELFGDLKKVVSDLYQSNPLVGYCQSFHDTYQQWFSSNVLSSHWYDPNSILPIFKNKNLKDNFLHKKYLKWEESLSVKIIQLNCDVKFVNADGEECTLSQHDFQRYCFGLLGDYAKSYQQCFSMDNQYEDLQVQLIQGMDSGELPSDNSIRKKIESFFSNLQVNFV